MSNFPVFLTDQARVKFMNTMLNKINSSDRPLSMDQLEGFMNESHQAALQVSKSIEEEKNSYNLTLTNEQALEELKGLNSIIIDFGYSNFDKAIQVAIETAHLDEEEAEEIYENSNGLAISLYLNNGDYAMEEAEAFIKTGEWESIVLKDRRNPLDSNRFISILPAPAVPKDTLDSQRVQEEVLTELDKEKIQALSEHLNIPVQAIEKVKIEGIEQFHVGNRGGYERCIVVTEEEREPLARQEVRNRAFIDWWEYDIQKLAKILNLSEEEIENNLGKEDGAYTGYAVEDLVEKTVGKEAFVQAILNDYNHDEGWALLLNPVDNGEYKVGKFYIYYWA